MPWCGQIAARSTFLRSPLMVAPRTPSPSPLLLPHPRLASSMSVMMIRLMTPDTATEPNPLPLTPMYPTRPPRPESESSFAVTRASAFPLASRPFLCLFPLVFYLHFFWPAFLDVAQNEYSIFRHSQ